MGHAGMGRSKKSWDEGGTKFGIVRRGKNEVIKTIP